MTQVFAGRRTFTHVRNGIALHSTGSDSMKTERPRFSFIVKFYLATFFTILWLLPICLVATVGHLAELPMTGRVYMHF